MSPLAKTGRPLLESRKTTVLLLEPELPENRMLEWSKVQSLEVFVVWGLWSIPLTFSWQPVASYTKVNNQVTYSKGASWVLGYLSSPEVERYWLDGVSLFWAGYGTCGIKEWSARVIWNGKDSHEFYGHTYLASRVLLDENRHWLGIDLQGCGLSLKDLLPKKQHFSPGSKSEYHNIMP